MLRRILLAAALWCGLAAPAWDASRFWNPYIVSGAISGTGGVCRLTISPAITGSGLLAGNTVITTGITGATGCNVTATISTVVDSTHIELTGTTFGGAYVNGGCVAGGNLTSTNTSNWAASSTATCGSGGQTVPGSADTATFDANSLGSTITLNFGGTWTVQSITLGAFTGTWDNSVNNNNISLSAATTSFSGTGSGTRTIKLGSATYTMTSNTSSGWTFATTTNLTLTASSATITFAGTGANTITGGASQIYGTVNFGTVTGSGKSVTVTSFTINNLNITAPNFLLITASSTLTIGTAISAVGSASNQIGITSDTFGTNANIAIPASQTISWTALHDTNWTGNTLVCNNCFDLGHNTSATINAPQASGSGGGTLIGG